MTETFEKYLAGEMSDLEQSSFRDKLKNNQELASDFAAYRMTVEHLSERQETNAALDVLNEVHKEQSINSKVINLRSVIGIAASCLLVVSAYFLLQPSNKLTGAEAFAQFYVPAAVDLSTKGADDEALFVSINRLYTQGKYAELTAMTDQQWSPAMKRPEAILIRGNAYLSDGKFDTAIDVFAELKRHSNFKNEYHFYSALAQMAAGKENQARANFELISKDSNYRKMVNKILERLLE